MAFDINDQTHLTALKDEVLNDPAGVGYSSLRNTDDIVRLLNSAADNTTGATVNQPLDNLIVAQISEIINEAEYTVLAEYDKAWVVALIQQPYDTPVSEYKNKFLEVFGDGSSTRAAAQGLLAVPASRAQELFGYGVVLTKSDYVAARDNG